MQIQTVKINKRYAEKLLSANTQNRKKSDKHIRFLSEQMSTGRWKFTGDPIKISDTGVLLDGQHRLHAVVDSNTEHSFILMEGLNDDVFDVLDTGKNRSASDVLSIENIPYSTAIASLATKIIKYNNGDYSNIMGGKGVGGKVKNLLSNASILDFAKSNDLLQYVLSGHDLYSHSRIISVSEYSFFLYIFSKKSREDAFIFLQRFASGANLSTDDPILYVRNKIIESKQSMYKLTPRVKLIYIIRAWNMFREGDSCRRMNIKLTDEIPKLK